MWCGVVWCWLRVGLSVECSGGGFLWFWSEWPQQTADSDEGWVGCLREVWPHNKDRGSGRDGHSLAAVLRLILVVLCAEELSMQLVQINDSGPLLTNLMCLCK